MGKNKNQDSEKISQARAARQDACPTVSRVFDDGSMVELVYDPTKRQTSLLQGGKEGWAHHSRLTLPTGETLVPYSPDNNLIATGAVLLPSAPEDYDDDAKLVGEVTAFIHQYVDLSPVFEKIAAYYVLLTWVYDAFNELPYLRLRGDYGTGKTRALLAIGSLCYKPFFASGASTVSPIFHTLDAFAGTLVVDEGDFRFSDEKADIVKILNNGNVRGIPILRTMQNGQREFNPRAFRVFGPKIIATRGEYEDKALESRFVTEVMGGGTLRDDIPINLPDSFSQEALAIRNKLLAYRLARRHAVRIDAALADRTLEPRANQVLIPLLSLIADQAVRNAVKEMAYGLQAERLAERSTSSEAQVLEVLCGLIDHVKPKSIPVNDVAGQFTELFGQGYNRPVTNRWIGSQLRRLGLHTFKSHGVYVVSATDVPRIKTLCDRFGIVSETNIMPPETDAVQVEVGSL